MSRADPVLMMRQTIEWLLALPEEEKQRMEEAQNYTFTMSEPAPKRMPPGPAADEEVRSSGPTCVTLNVGCNEAVHLLCQLGVRPAVLNFAHGYNCGGGFEHTGGSQEEAIFRASSIFLSLWPHRRAGDGPGVLKRGRWIGAYDGALPRKEPFYELAECGGVYSPHVRLVRDCAQPGNPLSQGGDVESLPTFAVLTAAAQDVSRDGCFEVDLLHEKARTVLHMAACNGHDTLVLGAFGCGYFRNPPSVVAEVFRELLCGEFAAAFSRVVFAIPDRHGSNLTEFCTRFPMVSDTQPAAKLDLVTRSKRQAEKDRRDSRRKS